MLVVSDSGPILSFARAGRLDLIRQVFPKIIIPHAVYEDIVLRGKGKPGADEVKQASWIERRAVIDHSFVEALPQKLHLGEREAIALAKELNAVLLIDEHVARKEAVSRGIECVGSMRVLSRAKERNLIPAAKPILDHLIAAGSYIAKPLYQEFLRRMGED